MWSPFHKNFRLHGKTKLVYYVMVMSSLFVVFFVINTRFKYSKTNEVSSRKQIIFKSLTTTEKAHEERTEPHRRRYGMKYILLMTDSKNYPFVYFGEGTTVFDNKMCEWRNCYVTDNSELLGNYEKFDVIAFNGPQLTDLYNTGSLLVMRSHRQKYVYANIESAANYPLCNKRWNGFFNWTWTYRLNSDAIWGYFVVRNANHSVIGPSRDVEWIDILDMKPIGNDLITKLKTKKIAAAWFVSNCKTMSRRESFVSLVQQHMAHYDLTLDVYGACGTLKCPFDILNSCLQMVEKDYYFYFAFENALSEDYVTEKVIYALNHDTVPVVFGGANYSRFLPPGTYLNALELGPKVLAQQMHYIIQNPEKYYDFFRWKNHYSFHFRHESPGTDDYCNFCAMINDDTLMKTTTMYNNLDTWWTDDKICNKLSLS